MSHQSPYFTNVNPTTTNTFIKNIFNDNLPIYNLTDIYKIERGIYTLFKPIIYYVFNIMNYYSSTKSTYTNINGIYHILNNCSDFEIQNIHRLCKTGYHKINGYQLKTQSYHNKLLDSCFTDDITKNPLIVIQGGEALNIYSGWRWENVPTHDCDTRIYVNGITTYNTEINNDNKWVNIRNFRFLTLILIDKISNFIKSVLINKSHNIPFLQAIFGFGLNNVWFNNMLISCNLSVLSGKENLTVLLKTNNHFELNMFDYSLWVVHYNIDINGKIIDGSIVDNLIMCNHLLKSSKSYGQEVEIFNYFNSPFHQNVYNIQPLSFQYNKNISNNYYPITRTPVNVPDNHIAYKSQQFKHIYIISFGYMLFDTIRMTFVSEFANNSQPRHHDSKKELKYKQKLAALISCLNIQSISYGLIEKYKSVPTKNPNISSYIFGGHIKGYHKNIDYTGISHTWNNKRIITDNMRKTNTNLLHDMNGNILNLEYDDRPNYKSDDKNVIEALKIANMIHGLNDPQFITLRDKYINNIPLTEVEEMVYYDILSGYDPEFKEFALPRGIIYNEPNIKVHNIDYTFFGMDIPGETIHNVTRRNKRNNIFNRKRFLKTRKH